MGRYIFRIFLTAIGFIIIALLYWGWSYIRRPSSFPFHHLQVSVSVQYVDAKRLEQIAWHNLSGGFFSLDVERLRQALLKQPWVEEISFRREWPDMVKIFVQAKHPEARWGENGVISSRGDIFYPSLNSIPKGLGEIYGSVAEKDKILNVFQKLSDDLQLLDLRISNLTVDPQGVYQVTLNNGVFVMIGREDILFRFARFVDLYPKLIGGKSNYVANVDLRYSNGVAIRWKK